MNPKVSFQGLTPYLNASTTQHGDNFLEDSSIQRML